MTRFPGSECCLLYLILNTITNDYAVYVAFTEGMHTYVLISTTLRCYSLIKTELAWSNITHSLNQ